MTRERYKNYFHKISQIDRKLPEIDVDYVYPNEITNEELINYSFKYAGFLNYFTPENKIDGNWQEFYGSNFSLILVLLEQLDFYAYREKFKLLTENIYASYDINNAKLCIDELFIFLNDFLNDLKQIYQLIFSIDVFTFDDKLDPVLLAEIEFYKEQLNGWIAEANSIGNSNNISSDYNELDNSSVIPFEEFSIFNNGVNSLDKIKNGVERLNTFFVELAGKSRHQVLIKKNSLKNKISLNSNVNNYTPSLAITKTFIEIFLEVNKKSNLLTKKHLDFYYREVLSQKPKNTEKDFAHLVIFIGNNYDSFILKKDILFVANVSSENSTPILYRNINDIVLNQSKIKKVINLSLSYTSQNTITEKILFSKHIDIENPYEGIGNKTMALFGNNQTFIPDNSVMKMEVAPIGFFIGSKILFQENGDRLFNVTFYFDRNSFEGLTSFIDKYSKINQRDKLVLSNDLFKAAFDIYYSNKNGWLPFENFTVTFDPDNQIDHKIEYNFKLTNQEPSFDLYDNIVHGDMNNIETPLLKFVVNAHSFYNAFNFLHDLKIERISIEVLVKNNIQISLRNDSGNIDSENTFLMFGSTPNIQSFLDIQNENIFNRYTKDFCININWFNLPNNENGFKDYYKEYESEIENNSFQIGLSSLDKGKYLPVILEQQVFNLFESYRIDDKKDYLSSKTTINSIDFSKIKFSNDMNLQRQENEIITRNSEGILRISLLNTTFAFGHKLFTKLFTEISMNNAKWFKRKKNQPNEPISPSIKSISIDYVLETSELLNNSLLRNSKINDISVINLHPFGYEKIYPNKSVATYSLLPHYYSDNQFIIGLDKVFVGQELNIYFELEELKSEHYISDDYIIQWFYLTNNTWKLFSIKSIIEDTTKNLIKSGIIKFIMPADINNNHTIFNDELYYIKVELSNIYNFKKGLKNIYVNGFLVERYFSENEVNELVTVPDKSIDKLVVDLPEIDQIIQPYINFEGTPCETEESFYIRISEMLRTKNRFSTIRDISQAILSKFNNISLVDCLGNGDQKSILRKSIAKDADLVITLIPKFSNIEFYDAEKLPVIDSELLFQVKEFVRNIISNETKVTILNPIYEKLKVICKVVFKESRTNQEIKIYTNLLNNDISNFIAPWISKGSENGIEIKNNISLDDITDFIKERPYVNMIISLSIIHIYPIHNNFTDEITYVLNDSARNPTKKIITSLKNSIFCPVNNHQITPEFKMIAEFPKEVGINELEIGKEFIVQDFKGNTNSDQEKKENVQKNNKFTLKLKI